jgi:hypothetical protein
MASSSAEVRRDDESVRTQSMPVFVRDRLGLEPASDLVDRLDEVGIEWKADLVNLAVERFDKRLVEESARLRIDMQSGFASLRDEIARDRFELLKWSFYFWVGQFFASAAVMTALLGAFRSR